jgi:hypothetical protein
MLLDDTWVAIEAFNDQENTPLLVRYRPNLVNFVKTGTYLWRMDVIWTYEPVYETLMPLPEVHDYISAVEDALIETFEDDHQTILAFVFTGEGERWWAWYTTDIDIAGERLNHALSEFDELPIEITVSDDPEWEEYFGVMEDFGESEG